MKIDFTIPWVDSSDLEWEKSKNKYSKKHLGDKSNKRFNDLGTLKYVFRSIEKNCPWYNKIFFITCGHVPDWLDLTNPKLVIVKHEQLYFDSSDLPTFSSRSIDMNLPNLKGVSEHFIHLNDDFLIMSPLEINRFFVNLKPVDFLAHGWLKRGKVFQFLKGYNVWVNSINNCLQLINTKFSTSSLNSSSIYHSSYSFRIKLSNFLSKNVYKKIIWLEHWHHPQPYLLSTLKQVHNQFYKEMSICSKNKFRCDNDLLQYIYRYWQLASNNFYPYKHNDGYVVKIKNKVSLEKGISYIKKNNNLNFVCFNDQIENSLSDYEFTLIKDELGEFLEKKFPLKSGFER